MNDAVRELCDRQAITDVIYRYCRGLDRMDVEMARAVWHRDGTADYGELFSGTADGFIEWVWQAHAAMDRHSHQVTNILIEIDGDAAVSESYVTVALRTKPVDGAAVEIEDRGRYLDRWSRRDGRWGIDHRRFVDDLLRTHGVPPLDAESRPSESRRDRGDPSYEVLGTP
jgi:hypothetical protein